MKLNIVKIKVILILILPLAVKNMESELPLQNPRIYDSQNLENWVCLGVKHFDILVVLI